MKPKLVVHIGSPYAGTKTIQKALLFLAARMRSECGIHYASTERGKRTSRHVSVARAALSGPAEIESEYRALVEDFERSKVDTLLLTDEYLFGPKTRYSKFFKRFRDDFDITVICYLIRQDYFAEEAYKQTMRIKDFKDVPPIEKFVIDETIAPRMEYHKILSAWGEIATTMKVLDYRKEVDSVGLIPSLQEQFGLGKLGQLEEFPDTAPADARMLLALRLLGTGILQDDTADLLKAMYRADRTLAATGAFKPVQHVLGSREREALLTRFTPCNEALARDFGVSFGNERPEEPEAPTTKPDGAYLMALVGELSPVESMRLHRATQGYWINVLNGVPKQRLVSPSLRSNKGSMAAPDLDAEPAAASATAAKDSK